MFKHKSHLLKHTKRITEYSVEDYLNAVTANLILNIGTEPIKAQRQSKQRLMAQLKNGFQFYL